MHESIQRTRGSFVARFGERDARRIERAARRHIARNPSHEGEDPGSDEFRYLFLACIQYGCLRGRRHGIRAGVADLRQWCIAEDLIARHDGDLPDFEHVRSAAFEGWASVGDPS